eukprot:scaffold128_cov328-Pavlova_lutheri.AAC.12
MNGVESTSYVGQCVCRCREISHWLARLRSGTREESYLHSVSSRARTLVPTRVVYFKREHVNQLQVVMSRRGNHSYLSSAWVSLQHSRLDESWQVSIFPSCSTLRYKPFTANSEARTRDTGRTHVTGHQEQERSSARTRLLDLHRKIKILVMGPTFNARHPAFHEPLEFSGLFESPLPVHPTVADVYTTTGVLQHPAWLTQSRLANFFSSTGHFFNSPTSFHLHHLSDGCVARTSVRSRHVYVVSDSVMAKPLCVQGSLGPERRFTHIFLRTRCRALLSLACAVEAAAPRPAAE